MYIYIYIHICIYIYLIYPSSWTHLSRSRRRYRQDVGVPAAASNMPTSQYFGKKILDGVIKF